MWLSAVISIISKKASQTQKTGTLKFLVKDSVFTKLLIIFMLSVTAPQASSAPFCEDLFSKTLSFMKDSKGTAKWWKF